MDGLTHRKRGLIVAGILAVAMVTAGCIPYYNDLDSFVVTPRQHYSLKPYVIEPPDVITLVAPNAPEIDTQSHQLRPDGYITIHLIGDILASAKTPTQLAMEIEEKVAQFYEDVKVQVRVVQFNSKVFYRAGETAAGPVPFTGRDTVLSAVMGGGLPRTSWPEKGALLRPHEDPELIRRISVDMKAMIEKGDLSRNAVLEEGDIVLVPINPLAAVGVMIQNLLFPVAPAIQAISTPQRATGALILP